MLYVDVKGDSIKISFRTGFLGIFGKKETEGQRIINNLSNDSQIHNIKSGSPNLNRTDNPNIFYNDSETTTSRIFENNSSGSIPGFIVLGHEMAHKYSQNLGARNTYWYGTGDEQRGVDETNAMHYENTLRVLNNLPRRVYYSEDNGVLGGQFLFGPNLQEVYPPTLNRITF